MNKRVYIHIGPHKTGSTSIQKFLLENIELIEASDFHVCRTGRFWPEQNINLAWQCIKKDYYDEKIGGWSELAAEIRSAGKSNNIVTCELFSYLKKEHIQYIRGELKEFDVHVISFFRDPASWLESLYIQSFRALDPNKESRNYLEFLKADTTEKNLTLVGPMLEPWSDVFGSEFIHVLQFEVAMDHEYGLVGAFMDVFDQDSNYKSAKIQWENERASIKVIGFFDLAMSFVRSESLPLERETRDMLRNILVKWGRQEYDDNSRASFNDSAALDYIDAHIMPTYRSSIAEYRGVSRGRKASGKDGVNSSGLPRELISVDEAKAFADFGADFIQRPHVLKRFPNCDFVVLRQLFEAIMDKNKQALSH